MQPKTYFVKRLGVDTHCYKLEDALALYNQMKPFCSDIAVEEYNHTTGKCKLIRHKGEYFKNI